MDNKQLNKYKKLMERLTEVLRSIEDGELATENIIEGLERRERMGCFHKGQSQESEIILMLETILETFFEFLNGSSLDWDSDDYDDIAEIYCIAHEFLTYDLEVPCVFPGL